MALPFARPHDIPTTGDSSPAKHVYAFIMRMGGKHQYYIVGVSLAVAAVSVAPIEVQKRLIDNGIEAKDWSLILLLGGVYLALILIRRALKFLLGVYQRWLSESAVRYCRQHLIGIWDGDQKEAEENDDEESGGSTVSIVGSEIDKVGDFVGTGLSDPAADGAKLVFALGYMLFTEPLLALVALVFFLPQVVAAWLLLKPINRLVGERVELLRDLSDNVTEHEGLDENRLSKIFSNRMKTEGLKQALKAFVNILNSLAPLTVLVFGGYLFIQGETTVGVIVAFMSGFQMMADPARAVVNHYRLASIRNEQHTKIARWLSSQLPDKEKADQPA